MRDSQPMPRTPVCITGIGVVSGAGANVAATLDTFASGKRSPSNSLPFESTVSCPTFQIEADLPKLPPRYNNCRSLRLTMLAVQEALDDAGISGFDPATRVGICIGTTVASQLNNIPFYSAYRRDPSVPLDPVIDYLHANLARAVGDLLRTTGPRTTIVNACSSGTDALGVASSWINAGLCDVAVVGGADELSRVAIAGFWSLGVMSSQPCAPFDRDRSGLNLGEGAGIVVLESTAYARRRSKSHHFEIAGFGAACDAHHLTAPHPEGRGLDAAIQTALSQANITPSKIAFINAHGTATADNDRAEGKVISRIFGSDLPFLSTKGFTGHTLGAAGGIEAVFTILGLRERWLPASPGFENQADDIPIAPTRARTTIRGEYAMSTSLAFGGNNSVVLIRRTA
jgi:3-oxoacyl-[acyl-carrier-protein] synthase II